MTSEGFAPAKINLTLHVTGQREDGYHLLDSLVVFADIGDRLWFTPQDYLSIEVTGPFAQGVPTDEHNLIWKAAQFAGRTARITVEKNLPHGAGIGGGSSDAAAVLRNFGISAGAATLGADVPVCLTPRAQRMRGIGDDLLVVDDLPSLSAVLVWPNTHVATQDVFRALTSKSNPEMTSDLPLRVSTADLIHWLAGQRNDLQIAAAKANPVIASVLGALTACQGAELVRMSGSGATCFGVFKSGSDATSAARQIVSAHPDWWVRACRLN